MSGRGPVTFLLGRNIAERINSECGKLSGAIRTALGAFRSGLIPVMPGSVKKRVNVFISDDDYVFLKREAKKRNLSMGSLMDQVVTEYFKGE